MKKIKSLRLIFLVLPLLALLCFSQNGEEGLPSARKSGDPEMTEGAVRSARKFPGWNRNVQGLLSSSSMISDERVSADFPPSAPAFPSAWLLEALPPGRCLRSAGKAEQTGGAFKRAGPELCCRNGKFETPPGGFCSQAPAGAG